MTRRFLKCDFTEVTAICAEFPEDGRRRAILIHDVKDECCDGDCVVFDVELPEDESDARIILEETADSDWETLESVNYPPPMTACCRRGGGLHGNV